MALGDDAAVKERHDGESAAEHEETGARKKPPDREERRARSRRRRGREHGNFRAQRRDGDRIFVGVRPCSDPIGAIGDAAEDE